MYVIVAPIQIKEGHKEEFIKAMLEDARGSVCGAYFAKEGG
jgi:hypothetical protein